MTDTYFTVEAGPDGAEWFVPTDMTRGPWEPDACHAGPPAAVLVRACERALPSLRLARLSIDLGRPVPMAGFRIDVEVVRSGRATGNTRAAIIDGDDEVCVTASGMHVAVTTAPPFESVLDNSGVTTPRLADAVPGQFPIDRMLHGQPGFNRSVSVRYPPGDDHRPGATTVWMRTIALLPGETPSPFQRVAPLADCGNAFSRHTEPESMQFPNTDLVIALHRDPVGDWLGSRVVSHWHPTGVGLTDALLFDDQGPVGRALQTLLIRSPR